MNNFKKFSHLKKIISFLFLSFLFYFLFFNFSQVEAQAWLSGWKYRRPITIDNTANPNNLNHYQVLITLDTHSLISAGKMEPDCRDIRFTDSDETTVISYWIESGCDTASTRIWVKVPLIPASSNKTIYLYYGNSSAPPGSKMWDDINHLGIFGGVFDYDISKMQRYTGEIISVAAGCYHTCILKSNGNVDCYGMNSDGQSNDYTGGDAIGVAAGCYHTCILKSDGNVECYGFNAFGQSNDYTGGDAIGVAAGWYHTCILKSNGNVDCYGDNSDGQANDYTGGDAIGVAAGAYHTCILKSNGNVDCYGDNSFGQSNDYTGGDAIGVAAGGGHTCILRSNGNVDCYGENIFGQSNDYTGGDAIGVAAGGSHTCILKPNGNVDCYGNNHWSQANDYNGGDAKNPFRKYASPPPIITLGTEATPTPSPTPSLTPSPSPSPTPTPTPTPSPTSTSTPSPSPTSTPSPSPTSTPSSSPSVVIREKPSQCCKLSHDMTSIDPTCREGEIVAPDTNVECKWGTPTVTPYKWGLCCTVDAIYTVADYIFWIFFIIAVIAFVVAGYFFIVGGADPGTLSKAKAMVFWGSIAVVVVVLSKVIPAAIKAIVR